MSIFDLFKRKNNTAGVVNTAGTIAADSAADNTKALKSLYDL